MGPQDVFRGTPVSEVGGDDAHDIAGAGVTVLRVIRGGE